MKIVPFGRNVLVKRDVEDEKKTPGGIIVPANRKPMTTCTVVAVGDATNRIEEVSGGRPCLKPGDKVIVGEYSGIALDFGGESLTMVSLDDILGFVSE